MESLKLGQLPGGEEIELTSPEVSLSVLPYSFATGELTEKQLVAIWEYAPHDPTGGHCFVLSARQIVIDGAHYYDATWIDPSVSDENQQVLRQCASYAPEGVTPGHIIVKPYLDKGRNLYLKFLRNSALLRLRDLGHLNAKVVEPPEGKLVERYLLAELSSEEVLALLRGLPEEWLFSEPVGPLIKTQSDVPDVNNIREFSGPLSTP